MQEKGLPEDRFLTADQAATFLGISRTLVHKMVNEGKIPYHEIGGRRKFLISELRQTFPAKTVTLEAAQ